MDAAPDASIGLHTLGKPVPVACQMKHGRFRQVFPKYSALPHKPLSVKFKNAFFIVVKSSTLKLAAALTATFSFSEAKPS